MNSEPTVIRARNVIRLSRVGRQGPTGPQGPAGPVKVSSVNGEEGAVVLDATNIPYDDSQSGLGADNVQEAIDAIEVTASSEVKSFNGRAGIVAPQPGDYTATQITNTPAGGIGGTNLQAAINELDTEKAIDSSVVHKTGTETVSGVKTFTGRVEASAGLGISPNATLPGGAMGMDAPFGSAALRTFTDVGNLQLVAPNGNADFFLGGNNTLSVTSDHVTVHSYPIKDVPNPTDAQDAATKDYVDDAISGIPTAPVTSVNGDTGAVTLTAADVGAATPTYVDNSAANKVDKNTIVLNVKDHGAVGNGTTDDTSAIQDAIDAASPGGIVFVPDGTFIVDPDVSINMSTGVTLQGNGRTSIFKIKDGANVLDNLVKVENADRVVLRDFVIDGNRANQDPSDAVSVNYGVYVASSDDCRIENVYVHDTTGVGIHIYNSVGTVVLNNESSGNRYHGFECEQDTSTLWSGNRGHHNDRHGIFISPGEVGGTGSFYNVISGNSFDNNEQYGVAFGIDAAGLSIGLTKDNQITNNVITNNAQYGISIYRVDEVLVSNNTIAKNGFFGLYLYRAEKNQVLGNRFHNNSQAVNGAYDEILLEGNGDGQASQGNIISGNYILINATNKANYGIREATSGDGPNVILNNYIPNVGVSGRTLIQHVNTKYDLISGTPVDNRMSLRTFDDGLAIAPNATLPGSTMGFDAPFGSAVLRMYTDVGNLQYVSTGGTADWYIQGNNVLSAVADGMNLHSYKVKESGDIEFATSAVGAVLKSPDGSKWRVTVDDAGTLVTTEI